MSANDCKWTWLQILRIRHGHPSDPWRKSVLESLHRQIAAVLNDQLGGHNPKGIDQDDENHLDGEVKREVLLQIIGVNITWVYTLRLWCSSVGEFWERVVKLVWNNCSVNSASWIYNQKVRWNETDHQWWSRNVLFGSQDVELSESKVGTKSRSIRPHSTSSHLWTN